MSLYNLLHGTYPAASILRAMLDLEPEGRWPVGRFRDIYPFRTEAGELQIILYTRNGGGNRYHWEFTYEEHSPGDKCPCPGCIIEHQLPKHPNYVHDYDDDFDSTYAYIVFSVPELHVESVETLLNIGGSRDPQKMFTDLIEKLNTGDTSDPDVVAFMQRMKPTMQKIVDTVEGNGCSILEV